MTRYSIVVPVHDEQQSLPELVRRLRVVIDDLDGESEVILVDDGSKDASFALMLDANAHDSRFKAVRLSRNFGHQIAISAGIDLAAGAAVIVMDGDLQHPPELIPEFVTRWREGFEIVYGVMERRAEGWFKRVSARVFYRLLRRLTDTDVPPAAGDFRLVDRKAVDAFRAMRERGRYVRGMFSWIGFRQVGVPYTPAPRFAGPSKYTLARMVRLATDGILSFSTVPLRIALNAGFVVAACSLLFGVGSLVSKYAGVYVVPGWLTLVLVTSFIGGIQLMVIGVLGEYVGRIYEEVKMRPLYLVDELHGFERERTYVAVGEQPPRTLDTPR
jgi:polyisoprenyl-phosphate glycosyltransferase